MCGTGSVRVMAEQFHVASDKITENATLDEDLGATSLDRVEVVMSLEDEFEIDISDDEALAASKPWATCLPASRQTSAS